MRSNYQFTGDDIRGCCWAGIYFFRYKIYTISDSWFTHIKTRIAYHIKSVESIETQQLEEENSIFILVYVVFYTYRKYFYFEYSFYALRKIR